MKSHTTCLLYTSGNSGGAANTAAVNPGDDYHAELKLAHIMPIDHPNGLGAEEFARLVKEKTDGHVTVSYTHLNTETRSARPSGSRGQIP